jgi:hypothetical protein
MGRYGSGIVGGSYVADLSVGTFDNLFEAFMRGTWVASASINFSSVTSITIANQNQIVGISSSWITLGVRVGDIIRLTGQAQAGNNNINLRVVSVTATIITVAGTPLINDASADTTGTVVIGKKLVNPATPVRRSFYFEEYFQDIDQTEAFGGCRIAGMKITGQPDGMAIVEFAIVGASQSALAGGASPFYSAPTLTTTIGLTFADAVIRYAGTDIAVATAFELNMTNNAQGQAVLGSAVTPDVFDGMLSANANISLVRQDLQNVSRYLAETEVEMQLLLTEPEAEPKDYISIFIPRMKLGPIGKNFAQQGAFIETIPMMIGKKEGVTGYDDTTIVIETSAP